MALLEHCPMQIRLLTSDLEMVVGSPVTGDWGKVLFLSARVNLRAEAVMVTTSLSRGAPSPVTRSTRES